MLNNNNFFWNLFSAEDFVNFRSILKHIYLGAVVCKDQFVVVLLPKFIPKGIFSPWWDELYQEKVISNNSSNNLIADLYRNTASQAAIFHIHNSIGHIQNPVIVSHHQNGGALLFGQPLHNHHHISPRLTI
jgi:hypothetical protein